MNIKKGYTLVELLVIITVISILSMMFFRYVRSYEKYKNSILVDQCSNSIMTFINSCKQYCYYNAVDGNIQFDMPNNRLTFRVGTARKRLLNVPKGFKLLSINASNGEGKINFNEKGFTADACTMSYKDLINNIHNITISVGTSYVEIKD